MRTIINTPDNRTNKNRSTKYVDSSLKLAKLFALSDCRSFWLAFVNSAQPDRECLTAKQAWRPTHGCPTIFPRPRFPAILLYQRPAAVTFWFKAALRPLENAAPFLKLFQSCGLNLVTITKVSSREILAIIKKLILCLV